MRHLDIWTPQEDVPSKRLEEVWWRWWGLVGPHMSFQRSSKMGDSSRVEGSGLHSEFKDRAESGTQDSDFRLVFLGNSTHRIPHHGCLPGWANTYEWLSCFQGHIISLIPQPSNVVCIYQPTVHTPKHCLMKPMAHSSFHIFSKDFGEKRGTLAQFQL